MDKRILLITKNANTFLLKALIKSLNDGGFEVFAMPPEADEIMFLKERNTLPDIFLVYLEDYEDKYPDLFTYLEHLVAHDNKSRQLYLIGNETEINAVYKYVQKKYVSFAFIRPINSAEMIKQIELLSAGYSYEVQEDGVKKKKGNEFDPTRKTVLLVDDDSTYLKAMERWFMKEYNVYTSGSGMNTIAFLKEHKVDLILLDYEMPVLSGFEVFQMLRAEPETANIPVIFLTSKDDKQTIMEVLAARPDNYLLKTKPPAILMQSIHDFFESREKKQQEEEKKKDGTKK